MTDKDKPLVWLDGEIQTPPFSKDARLEAGYYLRLLQQGENLSPPPSKPMTTIGCNCHELKIIDKKHSWRIMYHISDEAIVILEVFPKTTGRTPKRVIEKCKQRLGLYYL